MIIKVLVIIAENEMGAVSYRQTGDSFEMVDPFRVYIENLNIHVKVNAIH